MTPSDEKIIKDYHLALSMVGNNQSAVIFTVNMFLEDYKQKVRDAIEGYWKNYKIKTIKICKSEGMMNPDFSDTKKEIDDLLEKLCPDKEVKK